MTSVYLMAVLHSRKIFVANLLLASGSVAEKSVADEKMQYQRKVCFEKGVPRNFDLISKVDDQTVLAHLLSWLR